MKPTHDIECKCERMLGNTIYDTSFCTIHSTHNTTEEKPEQLCKWCLRPHDKDMACRQYVNSINYTTEEWNSAFVKWCRQIPNGERPTMKQALELAEQSYNLALSQVLEKLEMEISLFDTPSRIEDRTGISNAILSTYTKVKSIITSLQKE